MLAGTPVRYLTQIVDFAATHRLPAIYAEPELVKAGGLMSYGPNYREIARRAPVYVDKILKGATPAQPAGGAGHALRLCHQPQDRPGARDDNAPIPAPPGR